MEKPQQSKSNFHVALCWFNRRAYRRGGSDHWFTSLRPVAIYLISNRVETGISCLLRHVLRNYLQTCNFRTHITQTVWIFIAIAGEMTLEL